MSNFQEKVLDKLGEISERTVANQERLNAFERSITETNQSLVRFTEQTHSLLVQNAEVSEKMKHVNDTNDKRFEALEKAVSTLKTDVAKLTVSTTATSHVSNAKSKWVKTTFNWGWKIGTFCGPLAVSGYVLIATKLVEVGV